MSITYHCNRCHGDTCCECCPRQAALLGEPWKTLRDARDKEAWQHAACLSIATGVPEWNKPLTEGWESLATNAVRALRLKYEETRADLAAVSTELRALRTASVPEMPARLPIPPGVYDAQIVNTTLGFAKRTGVRQFTVEYCLLKTVGGDETMSGRRLFQDYVTEPGPDAENNARCAYRIRQLLDATDVPYMLAGPTPEINTDHLHNKNVRITVWQRAGQRAGADGLVPIFNNVERVDAAVAPGLSAKEEEFIRFQAALGRARKEIVELDRDRKLVKTP